MDDTSPKPEENKLEHPSFPQPIDPSIRVWRYLDLAKFIWLLEHKKLYFSRLDHLNDPHEGSTPKLVAHLRDRQMREFAGEDYVATIPQTNLRLRKSLYTNCWHLGNDESEAMWRLYCPNNHGVAIQTSYKKLVDSVEIDPFCYIGRVTYIDYETQGFPLDNIFYPVMHKRISFAHEHEVRLVKTLSEYWGAADRESPIGITMEWSPDTIVDSVFVCPYAPDFFQDVVQSVVSRITPELTPKVYWSKMRAAPVY